MRRKLEWAYNEIGVPGTPLALGQVTPNDRQIALTATITAPGPFRGPAAVAA